MLTGLAALVLQRVLPARLLLEDADVLNELDELDETVPLVAELDPDERLLLGALLEEVAASSSPPQAAKAAAMLSIISRLFMRRVPDTAS
ncbi:MAG: hypothetical protein QM808_00540 [Steroidobacteraceae bacterium]